ncbi:MAG: hypothetical protein OIF35_05145, partial [Cellvibrionaceae bacterium]|nr:hypothetical protein [Cellvibrionaceae bacterium]
MDAPLNIKQALAVAIGAACSMSASATNLDYFSGTMSATTMPDAGAPTELSRPIDQNIAVTDPGLASTIIGDTRQIILSRSSNNGQAITANITPRTPGDSNH